MKVGEIRWTIHFVDVRYKVLMSTEMGTVFTVRTTTRRAAATIELHSQ